MTNTTVINIRRVMAQRRIFLSVDRELVVIRSQLPTWSASGRTRFPLSVVWTTKRSWTNQPTNVKSAGIKKAEMVPSPMANQRDEGTASPSVSFFQTRCMTGITLSLREERMNRRKHTHYSRTTAPFWGGLLTDLTILRLRKKHDSKKQQLRARRVAKSQPNVASVEKLSVTS